MRRALLLLVALALPAAALASNPYSPESCANWEQDCYRASGACYHGCGSPEDACGSDSWCWGQYYPCLDRCSSERFECLNYVYDVCYGADGW